MVTVIYPRSKYLGGEGFKIWLFTQLFATLFSMVWDFYMDWGLFRSKKPGKYLLRDVISFPPWFYYFAVVANFTLRFVWVFGLFRGDSFRDI